jgi:hypothetical protein
MSMTEWIRGWTACAVFFAMCGVGCAQETPAAQDSAAPAVDERFALLAKTLSGSKFSGSFTVDGQNADKLTREEYHILECRKLDEGNLWMLKARIKYGNKDVTVPIPIPIEWAGKTAVISLDDFTIPLMGTFDSQVLLDLDKRKYAGTWSHDKVGGHLFGDILPGQAESDSDSSAPNASDNLPKK